MKTVVIGEIGSAWRFGAESNQLKLAKQAIAVAKESGCDYVKFQWTSNPRLMEQRRKVKAGSYDILAWPKDWLSELLACCQEQRIGFLCSVFLPGDVTTIAPYVTYFKLASLEFMDKAMWQAMQKHPHGVIASTGGCTQEEVDAMAAKYKGPNDRFLHCTLSYPCKPEDAHLYVLRLAVFDGYSDHTKDELTGALAAAVGAKVIEVHFRLRRTPANNPDFGHSLDPAALTRYVANVRQVPAKAVSRCEEPLLRHRVTA